MVFQYIALKYRDPERWNLKKNRNWAGSKRQVLKERRPVEMREKSDYMTQSIQYGQELKNV